MRATALSGSLWLRPWLTTAASMATMNRQAVILLAVSDSGSDPMTHHFSQAHPNSVPETVKDLLDTWAAMFSETGGSSFGDFVSTSAQAQNDTDRMAFLLGYVPHSGPTWEGVPGLQHVSEAFDSSQLESDADPHAVLQTPTTTAA